MPYSIETKDGITIQNIPDDIPRDSQILKDRVLKERTNRTVSLGETVPEEYIPPEGFETFVDIDAQGIPTKKLRLIAQAPTAQERVIGGAETALALGTGATGGLAGQIGGTLKGLAEQILSGEFGTPQAAQAVKKAAEGGAQALTYAPRTEVGQEYTQNVAEALSPLEALVPLGARLGQAANVARPAILKASTRIATPIKEEVSLIKSAIPESRKVKQIKTTMRDNPTSKDVAKVRVKGNKVIPDSEATDAIKQGFEDRVISTVKSGSDKDRKSMLRMINIHKLGKKSADFAAKNRPADVVGKSIEERISFLSKEKKQAGKKIETSSKELKGKKVNYKPAVNTLVKDLEEIGVKISTDEKGKIKIALKGSDIEGDTASKKLLNTTFNRLVDTDINDGYSMHRAKRFIDTQVSYSKSKANPLSKVTERIVKNLRRNLNDTLGEYSPNYKSANAKFSDIINSLDEIQKAVGSNVDFDSPNAAKSFGLSSRKLLSNYGSRVQMIDALDNIETIAKKYGMKTDSDIIKQVIFVNEIDRMFGSASPTSFKGQIDQAINKGVDVARRGVVDAALDIAKSGIEKARGINEDNAIKSIEKVLKREGK